MEDFVLEAIVADLRTRLADANLGRVWQPSAATLVIDFRISDGRLLLATTDPSAPAIFLTNRSHRKFEDGDAAQRSMAAILRKRCTGARLESIEKPRQERVVLFNFLAFDSTGRRRPCTLAVELTGRSANAYFVDEGRIAASMRGLAPTSRRALGAEYALPTSDPRTPFDSPEAKAIAMNVDSVAELAKRVSGLSRTLVRELELRAATSTIARALEDLSHEIAARDSTSYVCELSGLESRLVLSTIRLMQARENGCRAYTDPNEAADAFFARSEAIRAFEQARRSLVASLRSHLERRKRLVDGLDRDVERAEGADRFRELGELLLAQLHSARAADGGYIVSDYYADPPGETLAPAAEGDTPQVAASKLFAKYQKAKRTASQAQARLVVARDEVDTLARLLGDVESATTSAELSRIERACAAIAGPPRHAQPSRSGKSSADRIAGTRRFVSTDGYEILVGRTSAANDNLTFRVAKPSDVWLHAADYPGSHVVVRNPTRSSIPHQTLVEAAQIAAFHSQARENALVDVRYAERRFITKPKGAAPGLVRVSQFKTLSVRPTSEPPVKTP